MNPLTVGSSLLKAAHRHRVALEERDRLIVEAVTVHRMSLREVAVLVGLTHAGVARIVKRAASDG